MKLATAVTLLLVAPAAVANAQGDSNIPVFNGQVSQGSWLRIRTLKGDIQVTNATGNNVVVTARRRYSLRPAGEITFDVVRDGSNVTICAIWNRTRRCDADGYLSSSGNDRDIGLADFTVALPRGVRLVASTGNGDVQVRNAGSEVKASSGNGEVAVLGAGGEVKATSGNGDVTVERASGEVETHSGNGNIRVTTSRGPVTATTGNGRIDVEMASLSRDEDMEFRTGNGSINVGFPANLAARIEANVPFSGLRTDFPIEVPAHWSSRHVQGTIANGSRRIRFSTGNGRITIRKI